MTDIEKLEAALHKVQEAPVLQGVNLADSEDVFTIMCAARAHLEHLKYGGRQPIGTAPKNQSVLVGYWNRNGKWRTVKATYIGKRTVEADSDDFDFGEYCVDENNYYFPEGWHEDLEESADEMDYGYYKMRNRPLYWMPLPKPPGKNDER